MQLPDNYDKKDSFEYVPETLREHYEKIPSPPLKDRQGIIDRYAREQLQSELDGSQTLETYWARIDEISNSPQFEKNALHLYGLEQARKREKMLTDLETRRVALRVAATCPVCGTITTDEMNNELDERSLDLGKVNYNRRGHIFRSCLKCYLTALEHGIEKAANEKIGKHRRIDLVKKALA